MLKTTRLLMVAGLALGLVGAGYAQGNPQSVVCNQVLSKNFLAQVVKDGGHFKGRMLANANSTNKDSHLMLEGVKATADGYTIEKVKLVTMDHGFFGPGVTFEKGGVLLRKMVLTADAFTGNNSANVQSMLCPAPM